MLRMQPSHGIRLWPIAPLNKVHLRPLRQVLQKLQACNTHALGGKKRDSNPYLEATDMA